MGHGVPYHIGIIPDGNRRYAKLNDVSLFHSYRHGAEVALRTVGWIKEAGVRHVSFFGTSNENFLRRPKHELNAIQEGILSFSEAVLQIASLHIVGDIDSLVTNAKRERFAEVKKQSRSTGDFVVHIDVGYSGELKYELAPLFKAIKRHGLAKVQKSPQDYILSAYVPPVDLVIRTGGKIHLSGFLPFQTTYAELYFCKELWGDFGKRRFNKGLKWFAQQKRTMGA